MRWKMYSLIALATLLVTAVPSLKTKAQGPIEYALILVVVGVGSDEAAEIHWVPEANRGTSQAANNGSRLFKHDYTFSIPVSNASDPACTQNFKVTVESGAGLNVLRISKNAADLLVNGEFVGVFDACFAGANRVVYQVGIPVPPGLIQNENPDLGALVITMKEVLISSYQVLGPDGETRASGYPCVPEYTLRIAGVLN